MAIFCGSFTDAASPVETVDVDVIVRGLFPMVFELFAAGRKKSQSFVYFLVFQDRYEFDILLALTEPKIRSIHPKPNFIDVWLKVRRL